MSKVDDLLRDLEDRDWYRDQVAHHEELPAREPEHRAPELAAPIRDLLDSRGIELYTHQADTVDAAKRGENVILTTPTASGKTLAFSIPVFETLLKDPDARALYIYPTKALSNDQLQTAKGLDGALDADAHPAVYDGDTPRHRRPDIRESSRLVITNPYGLHQYLPWHTKWKTFFENLRYVVLDEVHHYRGIFGSNVAWLLRRLRRILTHYGVDPRYVLSSATIANPEEHAENLVGDDFTVVSDDGSGTGAKHFLLWDTARDPAHSPHRQSADLLRHCVENDLQTLCFTVSRKMAELVSTWAGDGTDRDIRAYRAGYTPEERRRIENGLRTGAIDGAATTNALELGVDIGGLDAVLISGYPGTVVSTWQQAGRAGRGRSDALAALLAFEDPLDQYFVNHPDDFFDKPPERAVVDPDNPHVATGHLTCAAAELPLRSDEPLATRHHDELESLEEQNLLRGTPAGHVYTGTGRPVETVALDDMGDTTYRVLHDGDLLETLSREQAYREAHPGAVLHHQGDTYIVTDLDHDAHVATVEKRDVDHHTSPLSTTDIRVLDTHRTRRLGDATVAFGDVDVSKHYRQYRVKKYDETVARNPLDLPPIDFETESTWIEVPRGTIDDLEDRGLDPAGGLHAAEHAAIAMTPYHAMCDRWDLGGVSTPHHPDTGSATIFLHDAHSGGVGIADAVHDLIRDLLRTTRDLVRDCDCDDGCPSCVYSPKCGNENDPLDKEAAVRILDDLLPD